MVDLSDFIAMPKDKVKKCIATVQAKLLHDPQYRDFFQSQPKAALEQAGVQLKDGVKVQFIDSVEEIENLPNHILPIFRPRFDEPGLTQKTLDELDKIAGN